MPPAPPAPPSVLLLLECDSVVAAVTGTCGRSLTGLIAVAARARPVVAAFAAAGSIGGGEVDGFGTASKSYDTLTTSPIGADDVSADDDDVGGGGGDVVGGDD